MLNDGQRKVQTRLNSPVRRSLSGLYHDMKWWAVMDLNQWLSVFRTGEPRAKVGCACGLRSWVNVEYGLMSQGGRKARAHKPVSSRYYLPESMPLILCGVGMTRWGSFGGRTVSGFDGRYPSLTHQLKNTRRLRYREKWE